MESEGTVQSLILTAQQCALSGDYAASFETYLSTFVVSTDIREKVFPLFHGTLQKFNEDLYNQNRIPELFNNFEASLNHYPDHPVLLNDLGTFLYKLGYLQEACVHFQKAINSDMTFVSAEKNLDSVKNLLVERWHFRMLNDKKRNYAYKQALHEKIVPGKSLVLDIGSGTGLLSVLAYLNSPLKVSAIEASKTMSDISKHVFAGNKKTDIQLINNISTGCNDIDIGGKHNLLVTEIFDAGLFGEGFLQTLHHAMAHLLTEDFDVIPLKAELFVAGVQSDYLSSKYRLKEAVKELLNIRNKNVHISTEETYDTEDVNLMRDVKFITEPASILVINFKKLQEFEPYLNIPLEVNIKPIKEGKVDVFVVWFDLHLSDSIKITTNPCDIEKSNAWQQAIFYNFVPFDINLSDKLKTTFSVSLEKLSLVNKAEQNIENISNEIIRFLNDQEYLKVFYNTIGVIYIYLGQQWDVTSLEILDLCPFPITGLLMMMRGAQNLTCYAKTEQDQSFINKVLEANNLSTAGVTFISEDELSVEYFQKKKYNLISNNILGLNGDIDFKRKEIMRHLKIFCVHQGGLFLPHQVNLQGTVIFSEWLENGNRISDDNVCDIKIADFLNKFQVSQHFYVDIRTTPHIKMSDVIPICTCSSFMKSQIIPFKSLVCGEANAIVCSYQIQLIENGEILNTSREGCFVDSTVFMVNPRIPLDKDKECSIYFSADKKAGFKLFLVNED